MADMQRREPPVHVRGGEAGCKGLNGAGKGRERATGPGAFGVSFVAVVGKERKSRRSHGAEREGRELQETSRRASGQDLKNGASLLTRNKERQKELVD